MIQVVVSVFDSAAGVYGRPVFAVARGQAIRSFQDEIGRADAGNEMHRHPEDFDLYELGRFDDNVGRFVCGEDPVLLLRGKDAAVPKAKE